MRTFSWTLVLLLAASLIAAGCKAKTESQPPSAAAEQTQPVSQTPEAPSPSAVAADARTALNGVNTALAKHDLEAATVSLVQVGLSGQPLSDADRAAYQSSMRNLQAQLADAAARNDPKANEMIQLLKASHSKH